MTVKELIERLHEFDESLFVRMRDDTVGPDMNDEVPVRHANLPEHESYVLLTSRR